MVGRRAVLGGAAVGAASLVAPAARASASVGVDKRVVDAVAARWDGDLVALRRDIHRHPETAGDEERTASLVAARLRAAGLAVTTGVGGHGVVGVLRGARRGRTVAYRADIDAVPPEGQVGGGTAPAHLCGHDIHTTVGVGVAEVLAHLRTRLAGTVVFVFQPAEEALTGAAAMLADGLLDGAAGMRPDEIHALHCGPFPVGHFAVMPGFGLAGQDRGTITLTGPDAAARAQALATEVTGLGTVRPSPVPADIERLLADLQTPNGPLSRFVFMGARAVNAEVRISYRCWPEPRYSEIRAAITAIAGSHGAESVAFPAEPFPATVVPRREGEAVARFLRHMVGPNRVATLHAAIPFNGEDFALFLNRIPGTYTFLGVRKPGFGIDSAYPHLPVFDPDERAIGVGVRAMAHWLTTRTSGAHNS